MNDAAPTPVTHWLPHRGHNTQTVRSRFDTGDAWSTEPGEVTCPTCRATLAEVSDG